MRRFYRSRRHIFIWILSVVIVLSMVCSFIATLRRPASIPRSSPTPTLSLPTRTATPSPTLVPAAPGPPTSEPSPTVAS